MDKDHYFAVPINILVPFAPSPFLGPQDTLPCVLMQYRDNLIDQLYSLQIIYFISYYCVKFTCKNCTQAMLEFTFKPLLSVPNFSQIGVYVASYSNFC